MATWTYANGEAKRKDFMVFWITDGNTSAVSKENIEIIGKGIESMPISANAETTDSQDVLGNRNFAVTGYAKSMEVSPIKVSSESKYAQKIDELDETDATLDDLELWYLCVKRYKTNESGKMRAWIQKGVVVISDFADELEGVTTNHTVNYVGERTLGIVDPETMTFTPDAQTIALSSGIKVASNSTKSLS